MTARQPYSIKIFLPGGDPDGLRTIEKSNWSGNGLVVPRSLFGEARPRKELARTGVYVLIGPPEESGLPRVYVGEGDPIRPRLEQHAARKDFWTTCIAFTSKDENLNKAHVQYLEARLIGLAAETKRCVLDNGNAPQLPSLSEGDLADAEGFLAEMTLCFPVLGVGVFSASGREGRAGLELFLGARGVKARGLEKPQGFVVQSGSGAAKDEVPSCHAYLKELRAALIENGVLKPSGDGYVFTQDYLFASPSTAAGVVLGRSSNGRIEWKSKDGTTLKAIQDAEASS
ncbi:MAG TPA: GIY-YIG nuclease family protein [Gemmatimonadales bacterium]|nr:GIY-YIG nuclease family protein [Gemmatimonadales bacterium]